MFLVQLTVPLFFSSICVASKPSDEFRHFVVILSALLSYLLCSTSHLLLWSILDVHHAVSTTVEAVEVIEIAVW